MAVLSLGMGADQVRFLNGAPAVTTARCLRAVLIVTAINAGILLVRGEPSKLCILGSIPSTRSSRAPELETLAQPASRANRARRYYAAKVLRQHLSLPRIELGFNSRWLLGAKVLV
jgi:hypothetical protein